MFIQGIHTLEMLHDCPSQTAVGIASAPVSPRINEISCHLNIMHSQDDKSSEMHKEDQVTSIILQCIRKQAK